MNNFQCIKKHPKKKELNEKFKKKNLLAKVKCKDQPL